MEDQFETGKLLGRKAFAKLATKGPRWQSRNVPAWIREQLLVPYYLTQVGSYEVLYVLQYPLSRTEKVHFVPFARRILNEERIAPIPPG